jgi:16S rRNA processing protein RimM
MNWGDNMDFVLIGKVVSTHGIKGEVRILSSFPFKEKVFLVGNDLWIDNKPYTIMSYRVHKQYDMVTFEGFNNINDVMFVLKQEVFIDKESLKLDSREILDEDLIHYEVLTKDGKRGIIKEIFMASATNKIIRVQFDHEVLIPFNSPMIVDISKAKRQLVVDLIDGMK